MRHRTKHMRRNFPSRIHGSHMHVVVSCRLKKKIIKKSRFPRRRRRRPSMTIRAVAAGCGGVWVVEKSADGWRIFMAQISPPTLPCPTQKKKKHTRVLVFFFFLLHANFTCVWFLWRWNFAGMYPSRGHVFQPGVLFFCSPWKSVRQVGTWGFFPRFFRSIEFGIKKCAAGHTCGCGDDALRERKCENWQIMEIGFSAAIRGGFFCFSRARHSMRFFSYESLRNCIEKYVRDIWVQYILSSILSIPFC